MLAAVEEELKVECFQSLADPGEGACCGAATLAAFSQGRARSRSRSAKRASPQACPLPGSHPPLHTRGASFPSRVGAKRLQRCLWGFVKLIPPPDGVL